MFKRIPLLIATAMAFAFLSTVTHAQDAGALLDLLVKKKIITDQEAEEVRAELTKSTAETASGKWKLSQPLTEIELYGDARARFEARAGETGRPNRLDPYHDTIQRNRERYRLRLGLRGTLVDDWFFGIRLETSANPRSTNVTFGDDTAAGPGPFAKNSDGVNVGQAYIGYKGFPDITLTAGKMPNPFVNTLMVWDGDINPEGLAEQWKHTFNLSFGGGPTVETNSSYGKDGKNFASAAAVSEPTKMTLDLFANFAQFVYDDTNPDNPLGPQPFAGGKRVPNTDAWMFGWQVGAKLNFTKTTFVQIAPTLYNYSGAGDTFNRFYSGDPDLRIGNTRTSLNQTGVNSLLVYDMPAEFGWTWHDIPFRIFSDFAVNFDGNERAAAAGHRDKGDQRYAYQVGFGVGKIKAKHDWALSAWWQHTEQYALDPNLVDSDVFDSRVNMEGFAVTFGYALSDAITANLTYARGRPSDHDLGTGGLGDIGLNPLTRYQVFQADLNLKF